MIDKKLMKVEKTIKVYPELMCLLLYISHEEKKEINEIIESFLSTGVNEYIRRVEKIDDFDYRLDM